ncbi:MAG: hypothetical protein ABEJ25_07485 [Candidatus Bipolaricaulia bacterium]
MNEGISLVVATGVRGRSPPERTLNKALEANSLDLLELAASVPGLERLILVTNSDRLIDSCSNEDVEVLIERSSSDFHFGEFLFDTIRKYDIDKLFYIGGGSGSLFEERDFEKIVSFLANHSGCLVANNFYSSDMIGLSSAKELLKFDPPDRDNKLGWLAREAGFTPREMTRNAKTQLDLDTPVDLIPLKLSDRASGRLADTLSTVTNTGTRIKEILPQFTDQTSRLVIGGRLGASTWSYLENNAACQLDVISEGRGNYGKSGEDVSRSLWLGRALQDKGPEMFIQSVAEKGTGLFLDTRVLFDYRGGWPSRKDRFSSDLLNPEDIGLDFLRNLTSSAKEYPDPVVFGGHSMISGSLYLMTDVAWEITDPKSVNIKPETLALDESG